LSAMVPFSLQECLNPTGLSRRQLSAIVKQTEADPTRPGGLRASWFDGRWGVDPRDLADFIVYRAANPLRKRTAARRGPVRPAPKLSAHRMAGGAK
jgi:hypothetical protein